MRPKSFADSGFEKSDKKTRLADVTDPELIRNIIDQVQQHAAPAVREIQQSLDGVYTTEPNGPGLDRLDSQAVHRQSGQLLAELRRTAAVRVSCQAQQRDLLERLSANAAGQVGSSHSVLLS